MMEIRKYRLAGLRHEDVEMPKGAQVLDVQRQADTIQLWALGDTGEPMETRTFATLGTGRPIADAQSLRYIATVQEGVYVWHVFEVV